MNAEHPLYGPLADPTVELDLEALVAAVGPLWARLPPPADPRTSPHLDPRTVRYYQTVGVLPKPARYDGRRALYGHEHVARLVCVRVLQAQGHSLAQVQRALSVASPSTLQAAAVEALHASLSVPPSPLSVPPLASLPPTLVPPTLVPAGPILPTPGSPGPAPEPLTSSLRPLLTVELAPGLQLLIDPAQHARPDAVVASLAEALRHFMKVRT